METIEITRMSAGTLFNAFRNRDYNNKNISNSHDLMIRENNKNNSFSIDNDNYNEFIQDFNFNKNRTTFIKINKTTQNENHINSTNDKENVY